MLSMASRSETLRRQLIKSLGDHAIHSGADLARNLDLSRTAIWKHIRHLQSAGLPIESVKGRGYCLPHPVELLHTRKIKSHISERAADEITALEVFFETTSTNQLLVERLARASIHGRVVLAEYQSQGRGRRGNAWISPMGLSLNLSLGWHFDEPPEHIGCLSLMCGVAVMRVFNKLKIPGAGLKWPNDILAGDRKLGGILVESRGEIAGPLDLIIGIGINVGGMTGIESINQPATDLAALIERVPSRNRLAGLLIDELVCVLVRLPKLPKSRILEEWRRYDSACGRQATVTLPGRSCSGKVIGIDDDGLLLMRINDEVKRFTSGQVSLAMHR